MRPAPDSLDAAKPIWRRTWKSGRDGFSGLGRVLGEDLLDDGRKLRADRLPVSDAVVLQVHGHGVGAGIVGADHLDGAAIAGAILFDAHNAVVGLLAGAKTRQTNHHHGDTVPFKFLCSVAVSGVFPFAAIDIKARENQEPARRDCSAT